MSGFNLTAESERPSERSIGFVGLCITHVMRADLLALLRFFRSASIDRVLSPLAASTTSSPGVCLQSLPSQPDLRQSLPDQRPSHPTPRSVDSTAHYLRFRDVLHSFVQQLATEHLRLVLAYVRYRQDWREVLAGLDADIRQNDEEATLLPRNHRRLHQAVEADTIRHHQLSQKLVYEILPLIILSRGP